MKKVRYLVGAAGLAPAVAGVMAPATAQATPAGHSPSRGKPVAAKTVSLHRVGAPAVRPDKVYSCFDFESGYYGWCNAPIINQPAEFIPDSTSPFLLYNGDRVKVTCWFTASGGRVYDHLVREDSVSHMEGPWNYPGHIRDHYVSFSNQNPGSVHLHRCPA